MRRLVCTQILCQTLKVSAAKVSAGNAFCKDNKLKDKIRYSIFWEVRHYFSVAVKCIIKCYKQLK